VIESTFREMGACCPAYPSIVAAGANATTLHYDVNDAPIGATRVMLTDVGAEGERSAGDTTSA